ncbi:hypothetical protein EHS13_35045 [Paenibacillus psychroresistens]|uniref:DUF6259 domain-containing protein n=1 Tax=Paenibacillus psychroresistens TaxID=1778678 RepID=A0A6B8RTJ0_9BACL|nr:DUF6259 domain-containing protein [Paenibacillus psychroresistens]QGQ99711.1 hypothetical protein EHS13_35045 [Paenibacillus psychroresistens]
MNYRLENEYIAVEFSPETGALSGLLNKQNDWQVIRQPKLAMGIRLTVPIPNHRNNRILSERQKLSSYWNLAPNKVKLKWDKVEGDKSGVMDIKVQLVVTLEKDQIHFVLEIDNQSPYIVEEAWAPCLGGLREQKGEPHLSSMSINMCGGFREVAHGPTFPNQLGYWGTDHPSFLMTYPESSVLTPFILLTNGLNGIYLGQHDQEQNIVNFLHELKPGYIDSKHSRVTEEDEIDGVPAGYVISAIRLPFIQPGESMTLAPMVIRMYEGSWHEGLKPYMDWRQTWHARGPLPEWAEDIDCWMTLHINSPEGCCQHSYLELIDIAREAKERGVGAIQLIGWARGGQDGDVPFHDFDPRLGTEEDLKTAIREMEQLGVRVLLMCKFKWADRTTSEYTEEILPHTMKDMYGEPVYFQGYAYQTMTQQLGGASRRTGATLCHLSADYRKLALRELQKILELGSSGLLYDELTSDDRLLCFDPSHNHRYGENNVKGSTRLAEEFNEACMQHNPQFLLAGEGGNDHLSQMYLINYVRSNDSWAGWETNHRAAWKYMDPEMKMATCLTGWDDREMVNQCLAYGYIINYEPYNFKGRLSDYPRTVEYGQQAQQLRKKLKDYLWDGTFQDTIGAKVVANQEQEFLYSVFINKQNGKKAVVLANQTVDILDALVTLVGKEATFELYRLGQKEVEESQGIVIVQPRSVIVLVEK